MIGRAGPSDIASPWQGGVGESWELITIYVKYECVGEKKKVILICLPFSEFCFALAESEKSVSHSVMSNSLWLHGL